MLKLLVLLIIVYLAFTNIDGIKTYFKGTDFSLDSSKQSFENLRNSAEQKIEDIKDASQEIQEAKSAIQKLTQ